MEAGIKRMMDAQEQPYNFAAFEANHVKETRLPADIAHAVAFFVSPLAVITSRAQTCAWAAA